jgi:hypothetical protein
VRRDSTAVAPPAGLKVIPRRRVVSALAWPAPCGALSAKRPSTVRSTIFISCSAKLAPRQRRRPPPNGIQV